MRYSILVAPLGDSSLPANRGKGQKKTTNSRDLQTTSHYLSDEDPLSQAATVTTRGKGTSFFANKD